MRLILSAARSFNALLRDHRGATAVEYGLIISLIVISMIVALEGFAGEVIEMWNYVARKVVENA